MAFKNLLGGIRWKYGLIKYDILCRGYYRLHNYNMLKKSVNTAFFHKLENEGLMRVTIFLAPERFNTNLVTFNRQLEETLVTLLVRIFNTVRKFMKDPEERKCTRTRGEDCLGEVNLLLNGEPVDNSLHCSTIFDLDGELSLKIFDDDYFCAVNEPFITYLKIDDNPVSGTFAYPLHLHSLSTNKFEFKWFRKASKNGDEDWTEVGNSSHYLVQDDDVCHHLKLECVPSNESATGPPLIKVTPKKVQPQSCSYYYHNTHELTKEEVKEDMFRLVTYNILAHHYATTREGIRMYDYCPKEAMEKNQRISSIAIELFGYKSDIICLQEVDVNVYDKFWQPLFKSFDFTSKICYKDGSSEGTMLLYRNRKFQLLCSQNYNFALEVKENPALRGICLCLESNSAMYCKFTSLRHMLQLTALQSKIKTDEVVFIGNVHLYSHPEGGGIRIFQLVVAFKLLDTMLNELKPMLLNKNVSFILCGDFNSVPSSPIHDFVKNSKLDAATIKNVYVDPPDVFDHPLTMESAYEEPSCTNYTKDFQGCLDYIYYQRDRLEVDKVYPTASEEILSANTGIPSVAFPSDHLPLIADFKWKS